MLDEDSQVTSKDSKVTIPTLKSLLRLPSQSFYPLKSAQTVKSPTEYPSDQNQRLPSRLKTIKSTKLQSLKLTYRLSSHRRLKKKNFQVMRIKDSPVFQV